MSTAKSILYKDLREYIIENRPTLIFNWVHGGKRLPLDSSRALITKKLG